MALTHDTTRATTMDKKAKKKQEILRQRLQTLRQQLAGARKQMDDPDEVARLEQQIAAAQADLDKLQ
jgi:DNA-binding FrmR family transcriptional regulator